MRLDLIALPNACGEPECAFPSVVGYVIEPGEAACGDGWNAPYQSAVPSYVDVHTLNGEHVHPHSCAGCGALITYESLSRLVEFELTGEVA